MAPCDAETLYTAEFVVVFTTILHELTAAQVLELYRARWQVELEFKRTKSIRELDQLGVGTSGSSFLPSRRSRFFQRTTRPLDRRPCE
jgi:Transposase DDE domain